MRRVDDTHGRVDADLAQACGERIVNTLVRRILAEKFDGERIALGIDELVALHCPAGFRKEFQRGAQIFAGGLRCVIDRQLEFLRQCISRKRILHRFQNGLFLGRRRAAQFQFVACEIAVDALVLIEEQQAVHRFEVEGVGQRLTHFRVFELVAARVQEIALHTSDGVIRERSLYDIAALHGWKIILFSPALGTILVAIIVLSALLEGFPGCILVEIVLVAQAVEIIAPDIDAQILAPIVIDARPGDGASGRHAVDLVGGRAERDFKRRTGNVALLALCILAFPPVLGQNGKLSQNLRQFAIALLAEGEFHLMFASLFRLLHVAIIFVVHRRLLLQHIERPDHVIDGDRLAIVPFRFWIELELNPGEIIGILQGFGNERVLRRSLIERIRHQRVVEKTAAEIGQASGCDPLHHKRIETVEGANGDHVQRAAFRRIGIHIVVVLEISRIFGLAKQAGGISPLGFRVICATN